MSDFARNVTWIIEISFDKCLNNNFFYVCFSAPPAFIVPLQPYTGAIMNASSIKLKCRVECLPMCSITWLKDGHEIEIPNPRYYVNNTRHPSDKNRYDFESIQSILVSKYFHSKVLIMSTEIYIRNFVVVLLYLLIAKYNYFQIVLKQSW